MRNIIFYIHRTGLLNYFVNPICSFLKDKYQITVFHLNKRNGFSSRGNGDYQTIDISDYSIEEIQQTLKNLNPKAVIMLGFISIYELLMLRITTDLKLNTIYLEHGIYSRETASLPFNKIINRFWSTFTKNLFFLRQYRKFINLSTNSKLEKNIFLQCVVKKDYRNSKFSKALFFSNYGYKHINKLFHYDDSKVNFICYPLTYDNKEFEELKQISNRSLSNNKKAILIHQPFILDGLENWGYEAEKDYFINVARSIGKFGYELTLLVHPRENIERYRNLYAKSDIKIVQNIDKKRYKDFSLAIGHYSTALLYPVFLNIPIFVIDYGKNIKAENSVFYPLSNHLPIEKIPNINKKYNDFCKEYIGKSKCSFENAASILAQSIETL